MDDSDFNYKDATFQTGIDSYVAQDDSTLRLPDVVNFVALRETCLSEAPFVNRSNRKFWKKWMDSDQYITILCATLKILTDCINDTGNIDAKGLYDLKGNPLMQQMSMCIAEMLVKDRKKNSRAHDNLFLRLPELLCYMLLNSLHSCNPRQSRIFNSIQFRELLLDWLSELIGGIRLTNCQSDRKWLFIDTIESPITVQNAEFLTSLVPKRINQELFGIKKKNMQNSLSMSNLHAHTSTLPLLNNTTTTNNNQTLLGTNNPAYHTNNSEINPDPVHKSGLDSSTKGGSTCHFSIGNSPLVDIYMNLGRSVETHPYTCAHPVKVLLTTLPNRPLTSMNPNSLLKAGGYREKKLPSQQFHDILKTSTMNRKTILKQLDIQNKSYQKDMHRADKILQLQYTLIERNNNNNSNNSNNKSMKTKKSLQLNNGISTTATTISATGSGSASLDNKKFISSIASSTVDS